MNPSISARCVRARTRTSPTSIPRSTARLAVATLASSAALAAAPTAAYWVRSSSSAFSDHGMISASSRTHPASSSSHRPVAPIAERILARNAFSMPSAEKNDRPVRVSTRPSPSIRKRSLATEPSRHTRITAREPMCFSSQITWATPSRRYSLNASSGCSRRPVAGARRARRHRRRQVQQPARVDRESAHHLERGRRVLLGDREPAHQPGLDPALAEHVLDVQLLVGRGCRRPARQVRRGRASRARSRRPSRGTETSSRSG